MLSIADQFFGDWDVDGLRATIFHPQALGQDARSDLWAKLTDRQPESIVMQPTTGTTTVVGPLGESNLSLIAQADRTDWVFQPIQPPFSGTGKVLMLEQVKEKIDLLCHAVRQSLEETHAVHRLAFSPTMLKEVVSEEEGLRQLSASLSSVPIGNAPDFSYQVNMRCRSSHVPHAVVNRMARWFIGYAGGINVEIGQAGRQEVRNWQKPIRQLHLDINSDPTSGAIAKESVYTLFNEFINMAGEIARKGVTVD